MELKLKDLIKDGKAPAITEGPAALEKYRTLSMLVLQAIAIQSMIEVRRARTLALMLRINSVAVTKMLDAIGTSLTGRVVKAAAQGILEDDALKGYLGLNVLAEETEFFRNRFAHGMWASVEGYGDFLLLIGPNTWLKAHAVIQQKLARKEAVTNQDGLDKFNHLVEHSEMFDKEKIEKLIEQMKFAEAKFTKLEWLLEGPEFLRNIELASLLSEPQIQLALMSRRDRKNQRRLKARQSKPPQAQKP